MTNSHDEAPPITSVAELMAVGAAMADRAVTRYREHAAAIAAAGNAEAAGVLQRLAAERRVCGAELAGQAAAFGWQPAGIAAAPSAVPDEMIDEDPYTVTVYRVLSIAMHDEARAFAFYAYVAAHAADRELQRVAEGLAHEQLGHAAELRRKRRKAWRRMPSGSGSRPPPPQSLAELRTLAGRREGDMAARHGALADAAAALGDLASAEVLRRVAIEAAGLLPAGTHSAPTDHAVVPAAADAFGLLRAALVDLEDAYSMYLRAAEGRAGEEAMLDAQRWAGSALRRSGVVRGRLTVLGRAVRP